MKIGINLILLGILSLLIGSAFASPLLISELELRHYSTRLPKGPTADISASIVYTNFSVGETSVVYNKNVTDLSYFVVLNITNNSDEWAAVDWINFDAAEKITQGLSPDSIFASENCTNSVGWESEGAWVDGKWYNLTWIPAGWREPTGEGYWMEGVQLKDKAVGSAVAGNVTNIYMNMNGTWVDVTGRIQWIDYEGNVVNKLSERVNCLASISGVFFSELKFLCHAGIGSTLTSVSENGTVEEIENPETLHSSLTTNVTDEFNNLWAPHQSRLIAILTNRRILSEYVEPSKLEQLETTLLYLRASVHHHLNSNLGVYDTTAYIDEIKQVQLEITEDGYLYNTILSDDQMFVMDSFGVEVFIEPRN
jgi:hypothetical protein